MYLSKTLFFFIFSETLLRTIKLIKVPAEISVYRKWIARKLKHLLTSSLITHNQSDTTIITTIIIIKN